MKVGREERPVRLGKVIGIKNSCDGRALHLDAHSAFTEGEGEGGDGEQRAAAGVAHSDAGEGDGAAERAHSQRGD